MAAKAQKRFDDEAQRITSLLPAGPRVIVIGSTDFWHQESEATCDEAGRLLATIPGLALLTGGVEGVGEAAGRSFFNARLKCQQAPLVYHVLPRGEEAWDYGETFWAGDDMTERREVLGRLSELFLAIEGGPGTEHEVAVASERGAKVIPVGRSGGQAGILYAKMSCPSGMDGATWAALGDGKASPIGTAQAILRAVQACLGRCA